MTESLRTRQLSAWDAATTHRSAPGVWLSITSDNRVKLWDPATSALRTEYADVDHLAMKYSCVAFSSAGADSKSKKRKSSAAAPALGICFSLLRPP
jgi:hypothetical protein